MKSISRCLRGGGELIVPAPWMSIVDSMHFVNPLMSTIDLHAAR